METLVRRLFPYFVAVLALGLVGAVFSYRLLYPVPELKITQRGRVAVLPVPIAHTGS